MIIAQFSERKQIDHALHAVARMVGDASLAIYGDGDKREALEALCGELGLRPNVTFKGHVPGASEELTKYSFLLFTSRAEGQGLVLLEAMARGCVPIAYDMRYGPRDLITHGVDGVLVPADDIVALASTIRHFMTMPEEDRLAMRRAAMERAKYFYPENNMRRWRSALDELMEQPARKRICYGKEVKAFADRVDMQQGRCTISGYITGQPKDLARPAKMVVCTRKRASFLKLDTRFETIGETQKRFTASFLLKHIPLRTVDFLDFHIQPVGALWDDKKRIGHALVSEAVKYPDCRVYKTKYGNLSFDCRETP